MSEKNCSAVLHYIHLAVYLSLFLSARPKICHKATGSYDYSNYFKPCSQAETRHLQDILMHNVYAIITVCILELHFMHSTASKMCIFVGKALTLVSNNP